MSKIRETLIAGGVRQLKEFGYPMVDGENILTDYVFLRFFLSIFEQTLDDSASHPKLRAMIRDIESLRAEVLENIAKTPEATGA